MGAEVSLPSTTSVSGWIYDVVEEGAMRGGPIARPNPSRPRFSRFLLRPYAVAGSRWESLVAAACIIFLAGVFVAELGTPDDVVSAVVLLPLLAAVWLLSNRQAALVGSTAILLLGLAVSLEGTNRLTLTLVGSVALLTALVARLYATALASLLSSHRHLRPAVPTRATPPTLDGIERSTHGIRSLTRRELDIARLGADGYATPEIARRLHIGDRTVESHLASVYSKLRIGSRVELIRMAARLPGPRVGFGDATDPDP
jgi:DNA-binding CsgD family transcriptional regulator